MAAPSANRGSTGPGIAACFSPLANIGGEEVAEESRDASVAASSCSCCCARASPSESPTGATAGFGALQRVEEGVGRHASSVSPVPLSQPNLPALLHTSAPHTQTRGSTRAHPLTHKYQQPRNTHAPSQNWSAPHAPRQRSQAEREREREECGREVGGGRGASSEVRLRHVRQTRWIWVVVVPLVVLPLERTPVREQGSTTQFAHYREKERGRERETEREREREKEKERRGGGGERHRERERERQTERQRDRQTDRQRRGERGKVDGTCQRRRACMRERRRAS